MRNTCCLALLLVAISPLAVAKSTTYTGEVVVRSIDATRIAVFLDTNADHVIDNGFLLTTDIPMHNKLSVHLPAANLVFTDGHLRVTCENRVYDLQVAGYPDPPAAPKDSKVVTLIGSALTHSAGDSGCDIRRAHEKDATACYAYGE
ncbi:MAG TPA: hypothetical protein VEK57_08025 [Thermoanaerobaculia bacterium]|nr:hypothetical protein [Thermoanaerobaculia bacterium]